MEEFLLLGKFLTIFKHKAVAAIFFQKFISFQKVDCVIPYLFDGA